MAQRQRGRPRCAGCGLTPELCACAEFPRVEIETPIVIVQHVRERIKPTNTARLLTTMVPSISLVSFPLRDEPFDERPLVREDVAFRVLYPRDDATVLAPARPPAGTPGESADGQPPTNMVDGRRLGLVVLDGTWHQCSRMSRRVPRVGTLDCVALPEGPPSIWRVRTQHDARGMSTFEAAVRALELLEGPGRVQPLARAFAIVTARLLFMKGKLRSPEVPAEWSQA